MFKRGLTEFRSVLLVCFAVIFILLQSTHALSQNKFFIQNSKISFVSDAPLELIKAESNSMKGVINPVNRDFAFSVETVSFLGFNSPLQREHFNENYMVSEKYPTCTFAGRIIDQIDFSKPGIYSVRAKGNLTISGVTRERIIRSTIEITPKALIIKSDFTVLLDDHNIRIPRLVFQKISPEINVYMNAEMILQTN